MNRPSTKVICISGKAGHGKDESGKFMRQFLIDKGKTVIILHYADLLKYICSQCFGWDGVKDDHGRSLLQYVGTDIVRKRDENFWVDYIARFLKVFDGEWNYAIIPDCRFPNECNHLKDAGFSVTHVRVVRTGFDSVLSESQQSHISETAMNHVVPDYTINNHSSLDQLRFSAENVASMILHTYERKPV